MTALTFEEWLRFEPSERKLRLFSIACAATVDLPDPRSRATVEVAERFADGLATNGELNKAWKAAPDDPSPTYIGPDIARIACLNKLPNASIEEWLANTLACPQAALISCLGGPWVKCERCRTGKWFNVSNVGSAGAMVCSTCYGSGVVPERATLCGKQHSVTMMYNGNEAESKDSGATWIKTKSGEPFTQEQPESSWDSPNLFSPFLFETPCPACQRILAWGGMQQPCERCYGTGKRKRAEYIGDPLGAYSGSVVSPCPACAGRGHTTIGTVVAGARHIYENRAWDEMPKLADALEEASCCNETILRHCREAEQHSRGCFVIDVILGKS
jgi:hypothetical protein